jgi:hypothetical protein
MLRLNQRTVRVMFLAGMAMFAVSGCDSFEWGKTGVNGDWKGQMVSESSSDDGSTRSARSTEQTRRILLRLEESSGIVQGRIAHSSDVIAFRQIDDGGYRNVLTQAVAGTLDGSRIRIRFLAGGGKTSEVDAVLNGRVIAGSYVTHGSADDADETTSGRFEIERF